MAKQRKFDVAQTILRRLIQDFPDCASAYLLRGRIHRDLGQNTAAIDDFERAIALQPKNLSAYREKGMTEYDHRDYASAIASLSVALGNFPSAQLLKTRAKAYKGLGRDAEAIVDYRRACQLYQQRGNSLRARRLEQQIAKLDRHKVEQQVRQVLVRPSPSPDFPFRKGSAGLRKKLLSLLNGDRDRALRLLELSRSRKPNRKIDWYFEKAIQDLERDRR